MEPRVTAPTLVLDLDGTLIDTAPDLIGTLNALLAQQGLKPVPYEIMRPLVGRGAKIMMIEAFALAGRPVSEAWAKSMIEPFVDHYKERIARESRPFPGAVDALGRFADQGWKLAICTNKREALTLRLLDALDLTRHFDAICGADTFGIIKPDPAHIIRTVEAGGGLPNRAIMVGDTASDVNAAKAAGIPVIGVSFGYTPTPLADLAPDAIIDHFDALDAALAPLAARF